MTERANFDAAKPSDFYRRAEPGYGQLWPDGAPWPDSSEHRHAQLPALLLPKTRPEFRNRRIRGTALAVAAVVAAVALWLILWKLGWPASIIGFLTAAGAAWLFLAGVVTVRRRGPRK